MKDSLEPGDKAISLETAFPEAYQTLQRIAHRQLAFEHASHTYSTSDLINEAYLNMVKQQKKDFVNKGQFYALASNAMRRILINYARDKRRQKRGGDKILITLQEENIQQETTCDSLIYLDEAIKLYKEFSERGAIIVEYWFFGGMKHEEIANVLSVSPKTVQREWRLARAWLSKTIKEMAEKN